MSLKTLRTEDGVVFRDLNRNGRMEPYEDPRLPVHERVEDLLSRMTLEEKCGLMFHTMIALNPDGSLVEGHEPGRARGSESSQRPAPTRPVSTSGMVLGKLMNHFNLLGAAEPRIVAE